MAHKRRSRPSHLLELFSLAYPSLMDKNENNVPIKKKISRELL